MGFLDYIYDKKDDRKKKSKKHEKDIAKSIGGRSHLASGAFGSKMDGHDNYFVFDCKMTVKESISVKKVDLQKLSIEAIKQGKVPVLPIRFDDDSMIEKDWMLVPLSLFNTIK